MVVYFKIANYIHSETANPFFQSLFHRYGHILGERHVQNFLCNTENNLNYIM